jgi:hypothetical protein
MPVLHRYPTLHLLSKDLQALEATASQWEATRRRDRLRVTDGATLCRVDWAGESWWLNEPQRNVVRVLLEALASTDPDVDQRVLIRASGMPGVRRLEEVFAGSTAWGVLVLPGRRPATYRLPDPPEIALQSETRIEPDDQ